MQPTPSIPILILLLEDNDVWQQVAHDLSKQGAELADELRLFCSANKHSLTDVQVERLEYVLQRINYNKLIQFYQQWVKNPNPSLTEALIYLAAYIYPTLDINDPLLKSRIRDICEDVEVRIKANMTIQERIEQLTEVFFNVHHFEQADDPESQHFAINHALAYKKGNSALLTLLYCIVAQQLGLPVYPVLTDYFMILGALRKPAPGTGLLQPKDNAETTHWYWGKVDLFIDPADKGVIIGKNRYRRMLEEQDITLSDNFFHPCSVVQAFQFLVMQFHFALTTRNDRLNINEIQDILNLLEKYS